MSLGGFSQGLSDSFQKAEDRFQDKKRREEARTEARLARSANQAFEEKLYTRRRKDDYMDDVMKYQGELKAIFGTDTKGLQMVAAVLPMGSFSVEKAKQYKQMADERGFSQGEFRNLFEVMYPDGLNAETFGDVNLDNVVKGMEKNRFSKEGDPRDPLSGIGFRFKQPPQKLQDFTELVGKDEEATVQMAKAHVRNLKNRNVTGERLVQAEAYLKSSQVDLNKKITDALDLARAKSKKSENELKSFLIKDTSTKMKEFVETSVSSEFIKNIGERVVISLKGNITPKLFADIQKGEELGIKKINSMSKDPNWSSATYQNLAIESFNTEIILRKQEVWGRLRDRAIEAYSKGKTDVPSNTGSSLSDTYKAKDAKPKQAPIVILKKRDVDEFGLVTYDGVPEKDYRNQLMQTLRPNTFYVIPKYNQDGTIDTRKAPAFKMHKGFFKEGNYNGNDPQGENFNPLGLGDIKYPVFKKYVPVPSE